MIKGVQTGNLDPFSFPVQNRRPCAGARSPTGLCKVPSSTFGMERKDHRAACSEAFSCLLWQHQASA